MTFTAEKLSDWHEEPGELMHDTPSDKNQLIAAMEATGYSYDGLESNDDNLRFFGENGQVMTMGGWHECEEWLNGVVFDDPQVSDRVEIILHPERFPEKDPGRAALRSVEDAIEQNDNNFDGAINNLPEPDPTIAACKCADEEARKSVLAKLKEQQAHEVSHKPDRPMILRKSEERARE